MIDREPKVVGYVVKRYPRFSETFIVNEILAHQEAGLEIEVFAMRPPNDQHFQDRIARVRAPITYLPESKVKVNAFWEAVSEASQYFPDFWSTMKAVQPVTGEDLYQAVILAMAVKDRGIGHLHAHFASSPSTVARVAARFAGVPFTFTAHAKDIFHEETQSDELRRKIDEAAAVITVSDYNVKHLCETFGEMNGRIRRVYNGLDFEEFPYSSPRRRPPMIITVGRLVEKKGFADLVDACAILADRNREFLCQIIGTGELEADLREQIESLGVGASVELVGARPQPDVIRAIQEAALMVAPCVVGVDGNRDGLPTVLLEAMALGTPCVSTDVTGIPEVVLHEQTGLMTPQHDPAALASNIERLLGEPDLRVRLAEKARALMEREFDVHRNSADLREAFRVASNGHAKNLANPLGEVR